ncbi:MAG: hypothetical protein KC468_25890 [Myxococcales bacterium]|nr:hypothetical protein [Myxococcales bacterium]
MWRRHPRARWRLPTLRPLDPVVMESLRERADGSAAAFASLRDAAVRALRRDETALRRAVLDADTGAALHAARTLKIDASAVGAHALTILARRVEIRATARGCAGVYALLGAIVAELTAVCAALKEAAL